MVQKLHGDDHIQVSRNTADPDAGHGTALQEGQSGPCTGQPGIVIWTGETMAGCNDNRVDSFRKPGEDGPN
jgi:hypothetical protein